MADAAALKERLKALSEQVTQSLSKVSRHTNVLKAGSSTAITVLKKNVKEAEDCMNLLSQLDDRVPTPQYAALASQRARDGLPGLPPSEMKVDSYCLCKLARVTLAEAFEEREQYAAALPIYKELVEQAKIARQEIWESPSEMHGLINCLALCHKRNGQFDLAEEWYQRGLALCHEEDPGSEAEALLRSNLKQMTAGTRFGPLNNARDVASCWSCGRTAGDSALTLSKCGKCRELKMATPAMYCSKDCQRKDWKERHKQFHRNSDVDRTFREESGFPSMTDNTAAIVNDLNHVPSSEYERLMIEFSKNDDNPKKQVKLLRRAIALDSSCPDGPFNLALTYQRSRDFEQAIDFYLQAMRLSAMARNPSQVSNEIWARSAATVFPMLNSFSECALIPKPAWMTDPVRLVDVARSATMYAPSYNETWAMLGKALEQSDPGQAVECYMKAVETSAGDVNREKFRAKAQLVQNDTATTT